MREDDKVDPLEAQLEAQLELMALQRQYRQLSNDKKTYTSESQNIVRRQKAAIEMLLREKKELMTLRNVAGRLWNQYCDENNLNELNNLLDKESSTVDEIQKEKESIAAIEEGQKALEEKIMARQKMMKASMNISQTKHIATQKQIRVMKNRLDNKSRKFNSTMAINKQLREKIDNVVRQKDRFQELYQRLDNKLSEVKSDIEKVSATTIANFHARDEAQHRMASLRERGERELNMFNSDVRDYKRAIEHDRKLQDFMSVKTEDRASQVREEILKREVKRVSIHLDHVNLEANKYERAFEMIKETTCIYDTDELVTSFIEKEDNNFALFNYVNAMSTDIEGYQDEIQFLQQEMEKIDKEGVANDVRRKDILHELRRKLADVKSNYTTLHKEAKTDRRILEQAKLKIEKLFKAIKCDRKAISELLGGGTSIDDNNAIQYLGIIEQKCNEMLQIKALHRFKVYGEVDPKEAHVLEGLQGAGPQQAQPVLSISAPCIDEETDHALQASDTKPLTMDEARALSTQLSLRGDQSTTVVTPRQNQQRKK